MRSTSYFHKMVPRPSLLQSRFKGFARSARSLLSRRGRGAGASASSAATMTDKEDETCSNTGDPSEHRTSFKGSEIDLNVGANSLSEHAERRIEDESLLPPMEEDSLPGSLLVSRSKQKEQEPDQSTALQNASAARHRQRRRASTGMVSSTLVADFTTTATSFDRRSMLEKTPSLRLPQRLDSFHTFDAACDVQPVNPRKKQELNDHDAWRQEDDDDDTNYVKGKLEDTSSARLSPTQVRQKLAKQRGLLETLACRTPIHQGLVQQEIDQQSPTFTPGSLSHYAPNTTQLKSLQLVPGNGTSKRQHRRASCGTLIFSSQVSSPIETSYNASHVRPGFIRRKSCKSIMDSVNDVILPLEATSRFSAGSFDVGPRHPRQQRPARRASTGGGGLVPQLTPCTPMTPLTPASTMASTISSKSQSARPGLYRRASVGSLHIRSLSPQIDLVSPLTFFEEKMAMQDPSRFVADGLRDSIPSGPPRRTPSSDNFQRLLHASPTGSTNTPTKITKGKPPCPPRVLPRGTSSSALRLSRQTDIKSFPRGDSAPRRPRRASISVVMTSESSYSPQSTLSSPTSEETLRNRRASMSACTQEAYISADNTTSPRATTPAC